MKNAHIVKVSLHDLRPGKTDWARIDSMTEEELEAAIASDPDSETGEIDWSTAVLVEPQKKVAISIRLDEDVLGFFKSGGAGYQRRINSILRHYMESQRDKGAAE